MTSHLSIQSNLYRPIFAPLVTAANAPNIDFTEKAYQSKNRQSNLVGLF